MVLQSATLFSFFTAGVLAWQRTSYAQMMALTTNITAMIMWGVALAGVHKRKEQQQIEWFVERTSSTVMRFEQCISSHVSHFISCYIRCWCVDVRVVRWCSMHDVRSLSPCFMFDVWVFDVVSCFMLMSCVMCITWLWWYAYAFHVCSAGLCCGFPSLLCCFCVWFCMLNMILVRFLRKYEN